MLKCSVELKVIICHNELHLSHYTFTFDPLLLCYYIMTVLNLTGDAINS